ncbi:MAG: hypothetical protein R3A52_27050 [Polyangiales bacterium]
MSRTQFCVMCAVLVAANGGCLGASRGGYLGAGEPSDAAVTDDAAVADATGVPPRTTAAIPGFDLAPNVGDFWEYEIQSGRPYALVRSVLRLELARATTVTVDGRPQRVFDAAWRVIDGDETDQRSPLQLAFASHRILLRSPDISPPSEAGRIAGWPEGWVVVFDAWSGVWPAGEALFGGYPAGVPLTAEAAQWQGRDVWRAAAIGGAQCQYVPGYGQLCGDDDPNRVFNTSDLYAPGIGVVAHRYVGCSSNGCYEEEVNLLAWCVGANASGGSACTDAGAPPTSEDNDAACSDGRDNDGDGYIDCMDFNCSRNPAVTVCRE